MNNPKRTSSEVQTRVEELALLAGFHSAAEMHRTIRLAYLSDDGDRIDQLAERLVNAKAQLSLLDDGKDSDPS